MPDEASRFILGAALCIRAPDVAPALTLPGGLWYHYANQTQSDLIGRRPEAGWRSSVARPLASHVRGSRRQQAIS